MHVFVGHFVRRFAAAHTNGITHVVLHMQICNRVDVDINRLVALHDGQHGFRSGDSQKKEVFGGKADSLMLTHP